MSCAERSYSGLSSSILCTINVGQMNINRSSDPSAPTVNSCWKNGSSSPSFVICNKRVGVWIGSCFPLNLVNSNLSLDDLRSHVSLDNVRLAHIADAEHQAWHSVSMANNGISWKQQRLSSLLRTRKFRCGGIYFKFKWKLLGLKKHSPNTTPTWFIICGSLKRKLSESFQKLIALEAYHELCSVTSWTNWNERYWKVSKALVTTPAISLIRV